MRPKYVQRDILDAVPVVAPLPAALLERSIVAPGLLAQIVVGKYCDHLPLYRQESIYWSRHQVWLPRQTMAEWVGLAAEWLQPIYQEIKSGVFEGGYVQVDETPVRYLAPGHGQTKLGYLWTCGVPRGDVIFHWETSRAAACLENVIPVDFGGTIQCDGYEAYDCFARRRGGGIVLAGCLAHVRRKFHEAREQAPRVAGWILKHLQNLYVLEAQLRKSRAGPNLREAERAALSQPVLARLHRALVRLKTAHRFLPHSLMGKAIDYALGQWSSLLVFIEDGRLEIDNNLIENSIRPTAIGKKNWLFIGEGAAGNRSAVCLPARCVHPATLGDELAGQGPDTRSLGQGAGKSRSTRNGIDVRVGSTLTSLIPEQKLRTGRQEALRRTLTNQRHCVLPFGDFPVGSRRESNDPFEFPGRQERVAENHRAEDVLQLLAPAAHVVVGQRAKTFSVDQRIECQRGVCGAGQLLFRAIRLDVERLAELRHPRPRLRNERGEHRYLGYILRLPQVTIYHSGDTVPYEGLAKHLAHEGIGLALLPVNGRGKGVAGNLTFGEAVALCREARIPEMIPHHFGMFAFNTIDPDALAAETAGVDDIAFHLPDTCSAFEFQPTTSRTP